MYEVVFLRLKGKLGFSAEAKFVIIVQIRLCICRGDSRIARQTIDYIDIL